MSICCIRIIDFLQLYSYAILNISLVFLLATAYSVVELLVLQISIRALLKTFWGWVYLLINGVLGILALVFTFKNEVNGAFLGAKILLAGTSALALLRVISVPVKQNGVANNTVSMIETILEHVKREYDRQRSNFDLKDIKIIMHNIDYKKAAESLPLLTNALLQTLTPSEAEKLKIDIQTLLSLEEGETIKHVILGCILAKYMGVKLLKNAVHEIREFISISEDVKLRDINDDDLKVLIKKYL